MVELMRDWRRADRGLKLLLVGVTVLVAGGVLALLGQSYKFGASAEGGLPSGFFVRAVGNVQGWLVEPGVSLTVVESSEPIPVVLRSCGDFRLVSPDHDEIFRGVEVIPRVDLGCDRLFETEAELTSGEWQTAFTDSGVWVENATLLMDWNQPVIWWQNTLGHELGVVVAQEVFVIAVWVLALVGVVLGYLWLIQTWKNSRE